MPRALTGCAAHVAAGGLRIGRDLWTRSLVRRGGVSVSIEEWGGAKLTVGR